MKPEVLVGALLFVVAAGLAYRFGSWLGRWKDRGSRRTQAAAPPVETAAFPTSPEPLFSLASQKPATKPAPIIRNAPAAVGLPATPPPMPLASAAMAPSAAGPAKAPAPSPSAGFPQRLGKPAVAALAQRARGGPPKPDVQATLPPGAVLSSSPPTPPRRVSPLPRFAGKQPNVGATLAPTSGAHAEGQEEPARRPFDLARLGRVLRTSRTGEHTLSLHVRIKQTHTRKPRAAAQTEHRSASSNVAARPPATKKHKSIEKAERRIDVKTGRRNVLASTKAKLRIAGRQGPRSVVLPAP